MVTMIESAISTIRRIHITLPRRYSEIYTILKTTGLAPVIQLPI
jgi:hypothetical protein